MDKQVFIEKITELTKRLISRELNFCEFDDKLYIILDELEEAINKA